MQAGLKTWQRRRKRYNGLKTSLSWGRIEGGSLFCDVENVKEEEGVEVFIKDDNDVWLKKACEDLGRGRKICPMHLIKYCRIISS